MDRFDMNLPEPQNELIAAVSKANPRTIVVINSGTPNDLTEWIANIPAILQAWYPGMEGGNAVADVLFGDVNPSGKLPVTFGKRREDYADYSYSKVVNDRITYGESVFVGYRHFDRLNIVPLFPFGHGLSYTKFSYDNLRVKKNGKIVEVSLDVKNIGQRSGSEVVQLYVSPPQSNISRPPKELKAFYKVNLAPGKTERINFKLDETAFSYFDSEHQKWIPQKGNFEILTASSASDIRLRQAIIL